jgi:FKBP-type peptidyl-prolyl cis-trans isomerase 2
MRIGMRMGRIWKAMRAAAAAGAAVAALAGPVAAGEVVQPGDTVWIDFACRESRGTVITTRPEVAADRADAKSPLFIPLKTYEPMEARAAVDPGRSVRLQHAQAIEHEIGYQLGAAALGAKVGEARRVRLEAAVPVALDPGERYFKFARVRKREKTEPIPYADYRAALGEPEVGRRWENELGPPATVVAVSNEAVTVRYEIVDGTPIETPAGPGILKNAGEHYEIHLQLKPGDVLRFGPMVGRVVEVGPELVTMDFGHPFGGLALDCEMRVERREPKGGKGQ